jgi:hypothetical protein
MIDWVVRANAAMELAAVKHYSCAKIPAAI